MDTDIMAKQIYYTICHNMKCKSYKKYVTIINGGS